MFEVKQKYYDGGRITATISEVKEEKKEKCVYCDSYDLYYDYFDTQQEAEDFQEECYNA